MSTDEKIKEQANQIAEARDLLASVVDEITDEERSTRWGLVKYAECASEMLIRLSAIAKNHSNVIEVARGVSARDTARIAELESHLATLSERNHILQSQLGTAKQEWEVAQKLYARVVIDLDKACQENVDARSNAARLAGDTRDLKRIVAILDNCRVESDEDSPLHDSDKSDTINRIAALVAQRDQLASLLAKHSEELSWYRQVTDQRDKIIAVEFMSNSGRYTNPDGTRMSELEILPAIIAERDLLQRKMDSIDQASEELSRIMAAFHGC